MFTSCEIISSGEGSHISTYFLELSLGIYLKQIKTKISKTSGGIKSNKKQNAISSGPDTKTPAKQLNEDKNNIHIWEVGGSFIY